MGIGLAGLSILLLLGAFWRQGNGLRLAFLKTGIIHGLFVGALTEILSLQGALKASLVIPIWVIFTVFNGLLWAAVAWRYPRPPLRLWRDGWGFSAIAVAWLCLVVALLAAPNNWDAMTYHLPRVNHWLQQQSLALYPTHNLRQLMFSPGASYWVAQFQLLAGSDRMANLPQWLAFVGCLSATSLLAETLMPAAAPVAMLVCASLPMAVLQAATPQNDLLVSFWLACFAYFAMAHERAYGWLAAAMGLALLTKPTAYLFGLPLGLMWVWRLWRSGASADKPRLSWLQVGGWAVGVAGLALLPSVPYFWRNAEVFGNVLGDDRGTRNEILGLAPMASTLLKHLANNLPLPGLWAAVATLHERILGIDLNNPRLNFVGDILPYTVNANPLKLIAPHEDFAASPLHLLLLVWGMGLLLGHSRVRSAYGKSLLPLVLANLSGLLLFSLLLKWQPWANRLVLPFFVLMVPLAALPLITLGRRWRQVALVGLAAIASLYAITALRHPLLPLPIVSTDQAAEQSPSILTLPRQQGYLSGARKELQQPYQAAAAAIAEAGCGQVGLALQEEDWEYPLWALMPQARFVNLSVDNISRSLPQPFAPEQICAAIATAPEFSSDRLPNGSWQLAYRSDSPALQVFVRNP